MSWIWSPLSWSGRIIGCVSCCYLIFMIDAPLCLKLNARFIYQKFYFCTYAVTNRLIYTNYIWNHRRLTYYWLYPTRISLIRVAVFSSSISLRNNMFHTGAPLLFLRSSLVPSTYHSSSTGSPISLCPYPLWMYSPFPDSSLLHLRRCHVTVFPLLRVTGRHVWSGGNVTWQVSMVTMQK